MTTMKKYLVAGTAAAAFVLVGLGVFVASSQSSSTPSTADRHGAQTNRSEMVQHPQDDPDHDWEADPIVPDGKPTTPHEFAEDAQAGQAPGEVPTQGPVGVTSQRDDFAILPPHGTGER
ncbi:hypothetical protein HLB23_40500 [Nocardia uniformis]|uniref:Uncharacterized protein n=1 Tax=Nocardia uniformis TaxID=53432 RepID=A0A849CL45_9NOCA|nr:hypothetical protein [Nocardia uniformis]NNH76061.1 hypothetical protein [Nocardia uniformis]